jgi:hypothetical protein
MRINNPCGVQLHYTRGERALLAADGSFKGGTCDDDVPAYHVRLSCIKTPLAESESRKRGRYRLSSQFVLGAWRKWKEAWTS